MKVRLRITGEHAEFVLGSLLARLPKGATFGTRDRYDAVLEVEPLELLKAMLHGTLTQIDPQRATSVDWKVEHERDELEAPRVDDIEDPLSFTITVNGDSDRLDRLFPAAAESFPAGVLYRESGTDDHGDYAVKVEVLPRWLVERAVADSIRAYDPMLAMNLGRVAAKSSDAEVLTPPAPVPIHAGATAVDVLYAEGEPSIIDGRWCVFTRIFAAEDPEEFLGWQCGNPMTGAKGAGQTQQAAHEAMVAEVIRRNNATG